MAQYKSKGTIDRVVPDSPAAEAGIVQGDRLLSLNGTPVKDIVGYQFHQVREHLAVEVAREGRPSPSSLPSGSPSSKTLASSSTTRPSTVSSAATITARSAL